MNTIIKEMSIGEIFKKSYSLFLENIINIAIIMLIFGLPSAIIEYYNGNAFYLNTDFRSIIGTLVSILVITFGDMAVINLVYSKIRGENINWYEAICGIWNKALNGLGATMLVFIIVVIGFICLVIPGLIAIVFLNLFLQFIVIEESGVMESLSQSKNLVSGRGFDVFLKFLVVALPITIIGGLLSHFLGLDTSTFAPLIIMSSIISSFFNSISTITGTLIYMNLKSLKSEDQIIQ